MSSVLPIRFINLDRDTERRERLQAELRRLGLAGERFPGVLWPALGEKQQTRLYSPELNARQFHKPLVNGEKGCYASHLALWQWLLESPHEAVVVLEDDVRLEDDFGRVCEALVRLPSERWDMVKLMGRTGLGKVEKATKKQALCEGYALQHYLRVPSLTAGYVINRKGAAKLIATRIPFGRPIDVDLRHWWESQRLHILGVEPPVIALDDTSFDSSIGLKAEEGLAAKWRKFRHKLNYTVGNAWHRVR